MTVALKGPSAMALTAGILLLSRSRSFGMPLDVEIVGDPATVSPVRGPAIVHAPVLASCGVGRDLGSGALVIVPGPAAEPLAISLAEDGADGWFLADRAGDGQTPASRAFVALSRSPDPVQRALGRQLRDALAALGCPAEPALIDLLCGAPVSPLDRVGLVLRAGQGMTGSTRASLTHLLEPVVDSLPDPLPAGLDGAELARAREDGRLARLLGRARLRVRDRVEDWLEGMRATDPAGRFDPLVCGLVEVGSHVAGLPAHAVLPPLAPAADAVAMGLGTALGAGEGEADANRSLIAMFRFLGGRFVDDARYPVELAFASPPEDRLQRWRWFCRATRQAADTADALWRQVVDPVQ
ncbi:MAG: hypothetical protein D6798_00930 [Deltaproteobacteria bacterium]|nr:MAG: hypothetical protein D6798_00930 [Deltaproteobacteria bacterium]